MKKTAVIGASGYIGSFLHRRYRETFPDCVGTGFSRVGEGLTPFDLRHPRLTDLRLEESGHQAVLISSAMPNVGWCEANPKESYALNVQGTLELVEQLAKTSLHVMFFSTDYVFDGKTGGYTDQSETSAITEYGKQKAKVEAEIPQITKNYTILRLSKIYGTQWKDRTLLDDLASSLAAGKPASVATDQFFSPTHVEDVVAMTLYVQEQQLKGVLNVCNSNSYSRHQIAQKLAEAMKAPQELLQPVKLHSIPSMKNRPLNTSLLGSPAFQALQSSFVSIDNAVKTVAKQWQQEKVSNL